MPDAIEGLVIRSTAGFVDVLIDGEVVQARIRGRLKNAPRTTDICVIGDRALVSHPDGRTHVVTEILPRKTRFSRRQPGRGPIREDVLVANHQSFLDPILLMGIEPRLSGPARGYLMRTPFLRTILRTAGFYEAESGAPARHRPWWTAT